MTQTEQGKLDELIEVDSGLTGWEMDFIANLDNNWRESGLTEAQADKLQDIWEKVLG